ncbi:hypothetical protein [Sphingobacterium endophyticum]|uniref:hypothetical protein n=1 Tax=Sphingobacterium endophyticum TaxID=2546448 RepID=UPI0012E24E1A|nr:hypothetical protein [Sphingobacterium endophyticum]
MKREELDKLRAKYLDGQTSLEEERKLKEFESEEFFGMLSPSEEKMEWGFDDFMSKVEEHESDGAKVIPFRKRLIALTSIAASLLLGILLIRQFVEQKDQVDKPVIAQVEAAPQAMDVKKPSDAVSLPEESVEPRVEPKQESSLNSPVIAFNKRSVKKVQEVPVELEQVQEDELYVEINGVRIYDEDKALEVTETALHLATSNLRKGMEGVEHLKYLKIEI